MSGAVDSPQAASGWIAKCREFLRDAAARSRLRSEARWILGHKLIEFALNFATLKLLTNALSKSAYGEWNLIQAAVALLYAVLYQPMNQAYLRDFHAAQQDHSLRAASSALLSWMAGISAACLIAAVLLAAPLSSAMGLGALSIFAAGVIAVFNSWRSFSVELLDLQRQRKRTALYNLGFWALQLALLWLALSFIAPTAPVALLAYGVAAAILSTLAFVPFVRGWQRMPHGPPSRTWSLFRTFGLSLGVLWLLQWIQTFGERFVLNSLLDLQAVGLYSAAFVLCGTPYMLLQSVLYALAVPIAYQRARDVQNARQLWSADQVLLAVVALYIVLGLLALPIFWTLGPWLLKLFTSSDYDVPGATLMLIAAGRLLQLLGVLLQAFFTTHQRLGSTLWFRAVGGAVLVPACWICIQQFGVAGAAIGVFIAGCIYVGLLVAGPGGVLFLVQETRQRVRESA